VPGPLKPVRQGRPSDPDPVNRNSHESTKKSLVQRRLGCESGPVGIIWGIPRMSIVAPTAEAHVPPRSPTEAAYAIATRNTVVCRITCSRRSLSVSPRSAADRHDAGIHDHRSRC
jgi:hypothetical protein